jgi:hypothetical protein
MLLQVLQEIAVLLITQRTDALHIGVVFRRTQRQFDPARLKEGCHAVVTRLAIDVALVIGVDIKGDERLPAWVARCSRKLSKSFFRAEECTLAVIVSTPSRSNGTAS